jgi:hypothetical protein
LFIGYFILETTSNGIIAQLLAGTAGISIMTAVAYYRSWSKRVEKPAHVHPSRPPAEMPHAPPGASVQPGEGGAVVGALKGKGGGSPIDRLGRA